MADVTIPAATFNALVNAVEKMAEHIWLHAPDDEQTKSARAVIEAVRAVKTSANDAGNNQT